MNSKVHNIIKKDIQIKKFCLYGFLKNIKFFEPYLIIYLLSNNITLFQVGILIAVREIIINIFEIPSGFIADYFGRKKELYFCFVFYIISFIVFYISNSFNIALIGMVLFGLGEAFRSGTHKAMIYTYLDKKNWQKEKTFVYGRTRSFSMIGSAISSVLSIILILNISSDNKIFLYSIIPYLLDILLISSYPKYLDLSDKKNNSTFKELIKSVLYSFKLNKSLRYLIIEESLAEASYSYTKDLIQPILEVIIIGSGITIISSLSSSDNLKVVLGIVYAIFNIFGSYFSRHTYIIKGNRSSIYCLYLIHICNFITYVLLGIFTKQYLIVLLLYIIVYITHNIRKPIFVDEIDEHIDKSVRASILSSISQLKSIILMILAPVFGLISDIYSIKISLILLSLIFILTIPLLSYCYKSTLN